MALRLPGDDVVACNARITCAQRTEWFCGWSLAAVLDQERSLAPCASAAMPFRDRLQRVHRCLRGALAASEPALYSDEGRFGAVRRVRLLDSEPF